MQLDQKASEQDKYNNYLSKHLEKQLYAGGSELKEHLMSVFNVNESNARQIIRRATVAQVMKSSKPYTFGKGQFIYLYQEAYLDLEKIMAISRINRPPLYRLLRQLKRNGGIIPYYDAMKITSSPGATTSTKVVTLEDMVKVLKKQNMVYTQVDQHGVEYILETQGYQQMDKPKEDILMKHQYSKMTLDATLIPDILRWLGRSNLVGSTRLIYRNKKTPGIGAVHNRLWWDAFSYTKATGINPTMGAASTEMEKQTLVVLDVVLSESYNQQHLDGFIGRIQINLNSVAEGKDRKVLPIIFYRECEAVILNKIAKLGIIAFDIGAVFGSKIYDILQQLKEVNDLLFSKNDVESSVKSILKTIRKAGQDDTLKDLKGTLFEVLMYPLLKSLFPEATMERGKILKTKGPKDENGKYETIKYEYDYIINSNHPSEIVFVELKGYMSNVRIPLGTPEEHNSLKWFFEKTLPFGATHFVKEKSEGKKIKGLYITSAQFDENGENFIREKNKGQLKSQQVGTGYERFDLLGLLEKKNFQKEADILDKFYTIPEHRRNKLKSKKAQAQKKESDLIGDILEEFE